MAVVGLTDANFSKALRETRVQGRLLVRVFVNRYTARILSATPAAPDVWVDIGHGDIGGETESVLEDAIKTAQLFWGVTSSTNLMAADVQTVRAEKVDKKVIAQWLKDRDTITKGRRGEIDNDARQDIAAQAGWRCQFDGCGEDLRVHVVPVSRGNYGYFAHIVASSSDGPRGDDVQSPLLARDPTNVMLLCDKCHRLIDRVDPGRYDANLLRAMRARNIANVKRALDSLRYREADMVIIGGNIEGQTTWVDERVAAEAMWLRGLRLSGQAQWFGQNGALIGAANSPEYWGSFFVVLGNEIPRLKALLTGVERGGQRPKSIAVFPKHGTSTLLLFGRLIGELGSVHLFQPHRDSPSHGIGGEWAWPEVAKPANDKFKLYIHKAAQSGDAEAVLQINLTARIPGIDLPKGLYRDGAWVLPAMELTVDECNHRTMNHPDDAALFGLKLDEALRILQDEWRVRTVHLIVVAPTTACFKTGQKMQARHQADFILYERQLGAVPGERGTFGQTIKISSTEVSSLSTGNSIRIT